MTRKWDKRVLCVLMQWDYCDKARGPAGDKACFLDNISGLVSAAEPFWYDEYVNDLPRLRRLLLEKAEAFKPDLVFYPTYTDQLDPATLDQLRGRWPTCGWFGDDTWRFESYSSRLAPHFTHVLTTDPFSVEKYRVLGVNPILTQWAAQPHAASAGQPLAGDNFRFDVSFVGGWNPARAWFIEMLARQGIRVDCFGAGWPNGKVSFEEMERIFRESRINLNLSNSIPKDLRFVLSGPRNLASWLRSPKNAEQIKARNFEIPLAGGFQLTNYVAGLERYLEIGRETAAYTSPEECAAQIKYYLANEPERAAIASAGKARAEAEHTYLLRFEKIFSEIWP